MVFSWLKNPFAKKQLPILPVTAPKRNAAANGTTNKNAEVVRVGNYQQVLPSSPALSRAGSPNLNGRGSPAPPPALWEGATAPVLNASHNSEIGANASANAGSGNGGGSMGGNSRKMAGGKRKTSKKASRSSRKKVSRSSRKKASNRK